MATQIGCKVVSAVCGKWFEPEKGNLIDIIVANNGNSNSRRLKVSDKTLIFLIWVKLSFSIIVESTMLMKTKKKNKKNSEEKGAAATQLSRTFISNN